MGLLPTWYVPTAYAESIVSLVRTSEVSTVRVQSANPIQARVGRLRYVPHRIVCARHSKARPVDLEECIACARQDSPTFAASSSFPRCPPIWSVAREHQG